MGPGRHTNLNAHVSTYLVGVQSHEWKPKLPWGPSRHLPSPGSFKDRDTGLSSKSPLKTSCYPHRSLPIQYTIL